MSILNVSEPGKTTLSREQSQGRDNGGKLSLRSEEAQSFQWQLGHWQWVRKSHGWQAKHTHFFLFRVCARASHVNYLFLALFNSCSGIPFTSSQHPYLHKTVWSVGVHTQSGKVQSNVKDELCSAAWFTKERQHCWPHNGYYGDTNCVHGGLKESKPSAWHMAIRCRNTGIRRAPSRQISRCRQGNPTPLCSWISQRIITILSFGRI